MKEGEKQRTLIDNLKSRKTEIGFSFFKTVLTVLRKERKVEAHFRTLNFFFSISKSQFCFQTYMSSAKINVSYGI